MAGPGGKRQGSQPQIRTHLWHLWVVCAFLEPISLVEHGHGPACCAWGRLGKDTAYLEGLDAGLNGTMSGLVGENVELETLEQRHSKDSVGLLKYTDKYVPWTGSGC